MSAGEPDDTLLTVQHVKDFLAWYRKQVSGKHYEVEFSVDWWGNALKEFNLGQLRNGIRAYQKLSSKPWLSPVEFHGLCKGTATEQSIERFRSMRETVRNAPPIKTKTAKEKKK